MKTLLKIVAIALVLICISLEVFTQHSQAVNSTTSLLQTNPILLTLSC